MKTTSPRNRMAVTMIAALSYLGLAAIPMAAQDVNSSGNSAVIVAHLPLPGASATQMLLQSQNGKLYLYVDQGESRTVAMIDVTQPSHPIVVDHIAWPSRVAKGDVHLLGSGMALSETPEAVRTPRTVDVLDMSDAAHPRVLETFYGVTSTLPDIERNLVFIANADGLWIVRNRVGQAAYAARHRCTSEAAMTSEPDCY